jgi:hypothetical protein
MVSGPPHRLEVQYGLAASEILDAIASRFRLKVALEGAIAEVHLQRKIGELERRGFLLRHEEFDLNGFPDFTIWPRRRADPLRIECKNVRGIDYRRGGAVVAFAVEVQKTRAARGDATSRYYEVNYFDILGVCLGKKTGNWDDFLYVKSADLARHRRYPSKLAVMHRVPLPTADTVAPWHRTLEDLLG